MKKRTKYLFISLVILSVVVGIYGVGFKSKKVTDASTVSNLLKVQVTTGDIEISTSGSSTIKSRNKKEIKSLSSGIVDNIFVEVGQVVNEGDLLLSFENDSTNSEIDRLQLELQQEIDSLGDVKDNTENLKVYAPQSGYIGDITVEVGDDLSNGYTFTTITEKDKLYIPGYYTKTAVDGIKVGDKATVTLQTYLIDVEGVVSKINQTPQARSSGVILYEVMIETINPGVVTEEETGMVVVHSSKGDYQAYEMASFNSQTTGEVKITTGGEVNNIFVSSGMYVNKGQLLVELSSTDIQRQIDNQQYSVDKKNSELSEKLQNLDDAAVYAPISGTITKVNITEGEQVGSNTVLLEIAELNNLEVTIPVDELDINKIIIGQAAKVTAEAVSDKEYNAVVSNIALEGVSQNGVSTFDVTLDIKESEGLKPGMTAEGKILIEQKKNVLMLPLEAIQTRKKQSFVLVEGANGNDNQVTPIQTGLVSENFAEIIEGLENGDEVVYQGATTTTQNQFGQGSGIRIPGAGGMQGGGIPRVTTGGGKQ